MLAARLTCVTLLVRAALAVPGDANRRRSYSSHVSAIRQYLFENQTYDVMSPPESARSDSYGIPNGASSSQAGTTVEVFLRVFKVESLSTKESKMRIKVWLRMAWQDDRLIWNKDEFGGVDQLHVRAQGIFESDNTGIWLPDIIPYNVGEGIASTLEPSLAIVYSTGRVFWSRPGMLDVLCRFRGINLFPYDKVHCPINVGGWAYSGWQQGIQLMESLDHVGYSFGQSAFAEAPPGSVNVESSANNTYFEWKIVDMTASVENRTFPNFPSEPWPVVLYDVVLDRDANFFYFNIFITSSSSRHWSPRSVRSSASSSRPM